MTDPDGLPSLNQQSFATGDSPLLARASQGPRMKQVASLASSTSCGLLPSAAPRTLRTQFSYWIRDGVVDPRSWVASHSSISASILRS